MAQILLLNGPNLGLLGEREPDLYGTDTLGDIEARLTKRAGDLGLTMKCKQSDAEHELIAAVHDARRDCQFILFNPGAFTHTSIALRDALSAVRIPFIELHLSNVAAREPFRRRSYFSDIAVGTISGFGTTSYDLGLLAAADHLERSGGGQ